MRTFSYVIQDENGLHARPAGQMVKQVKAMSSTVTLIAPTGSAEMTKLFAIMGLGVKQGDEITVWVEGEDEAADAEALEQFIRANF